MATREKRKEVIDDLCEQAGCNDKVKKIHFDQFVNHGWHPHPSSNFELWWRQHKDCQDAGIDARRAWNCQCYHDEFWESRKFGLPVPEAK